MISIVKSQSLEHNKLNSMSFNLIWPHLCRSVFNEDLVIRQCGFPRQGSSLALVRLGKWLCTPLYWRWENQPVLHLPNWPLVLILEVFSLLKSKPGVRKYFWYTINLTIVSLHHRSFDVWHLDCLFLTYQTATGDYSCCCSRCFFFHHMGTFQSQEQRSASHRWSDLCFISSIGFT